MVIDTEAPHWSEAFGSAEIDLCPVSNEVKELHTIYHS